MSSDLKIPLGIDVLTAARRRIADVFDHFTRIYVSFSGGKDSTVMLHLVMDEAIRRRRRVGLLFIDLEAQYRMTIEHVAACYERYREHVDPYWIALPLHLRNAVSVYEPHWVCWEPGRETDWVRQAPPEAIADPAMFPFFRHAMEFEEFVDDFGHWYAEGQLCCCFVGIRSDESLNRFRTMMVDKARFEGRRWTTYKGETLYNAYPIYDWRTQDIWAYSGKFNVLQNPLYDRMHKAGLTIHQQRICQPYGDDQRKGLWLFQIIEPETWARVVARVNGANGGAIYAQDTGNILGVGKITKPECHTWQSFAKLLLESMPATTRDHYEDKISTFIQWYRDRGYPAGIPDDGPMNDKTTPSWKRIAKSLLRNDYWCKGLSFTQTQSHAYQNYKRIMKKRRARWRLHELS